MSKFALTKAFFKRQYKNITYLCAISLSSLVRTFASAVIPATLHAISLDKKYIIQDERTVKIENCKKKSYF